MNDGDEATAVTVAAAAAVLRAFTVLSPAALFDLEVHGSLDDVREEIPDDIVLGPLLNELS